MAEWRPQLSTYDRELAVATRLAREAGAEVLQLQRGDFTVELKAGDEPVTIADRRASELILAGLAREFPEDRVISEEVPTTAEQLVAPRLWLVDPIDGTKDFIRREDGYAVMIGLCVGGVPTVGVVYQPALDRLFAATPAGAWVSVGDGAREPLRVSTTAAASDAKFVASKSHRSAAIDRVKDQLGIDNEHNVGSVGIKLCLIALGVRDLYVNPAAKTKAWDTCAPQVILARAGGTLTDMSGVPLDYFRDLLHLRGLVASNGVVHAEVIGKLAPLVGKL